MRPSPPRRPCGRGEDPDAPVAQLRQADVLHVRGPLGKEREILQALSPVKERVPAEDALRVQGIADDLHAAQNQLAVDDGDKGVL